MLEKVFGWNGADVIGKLISFSRNRGVEANSIYPIEYNARLWLLSKDFFLGKNNSFVTVSILVRVSLIIYSMTLTVLID